MKCTGNQFISILGKGSVVLLVVIGMISDKRIGSSVG